MELALKGRVCSACDSDLPFLMLFVGTLTAYGSYLPRSSNIVVDHLCICAADIGVSLLAGFSVYTSLVSDLTSLNGQD
eukprot:1152083-Pelagomonas_calceolata.AAC.5